MSSYCYKLKETVTSDPSAQLLYAGEAKFENDWNSTPHTHNFMEFFFVLSGKGKFSINNDTFPIQENDLILLNAGVSHAEYSNTQNPLSYIVLGGDALEFHSIENEDYMIHHLTISQKNEILSYFKALLREMREEETNYETICQHLFNALILTIMRHTKTDFTMLPDSPQKIMRECRFIEQYIDEHFREDITLQTLCDLTFLNKHYLAHSFKKYKGVPPITYLIQVRIAEAKFLLETTNHTISTIAYMAGFSSQSYFSQIFRKETGKTPIQYRKEFEKGKERK